MSDTRIKPIRRSRAVRKLNRVRFIKSLDNHFVEHLISIIFADPIDFFINI